MSASLRVTAAGREAPTQPALITDARAWSYAELAAEVARRAGELRGCLEARRGDRAALVAHARVSSLVDLYALLEMEMCAVLLHPRWTAPERARVRDAVLPRVVLDDDERVFPPRVRAARSAVVVYTSGSTGRPKGIALSRRALVAAARAHAAHLGWRDDDRWLLALPPAHVGGLSIVTRCLAARRAVVLAPAAFDPAGLAEALQRHRVTLLSVVPTMLRRLLDAGVAPPRSLRAALVGGAPLSPALLAAGRAAGWPLLPTYGLSEAAAQVCTQHPDEPRADGVGPPLPGVRVRVRDGEIEVGGPTLLDGYLPVAPATFTPWRGGFLATGDLGWLDEEGHLHVRGRADDRLISGGENVDPVEVEHALEALPQVRAALVFALPDEVWGERVAAEVVATDPASPPDLAAIRAALGGVLAAYKHPRALFVTEALSLSSSGKKDRRAARERGR
ncbi:MAG: class I adenylate-forming enzyme family protein [Sandaracinaceae bacterium]